MRKVIDVIKAFPQHVFTVVATLIDRLIGIFGLQLNVTSWPQCHFRVKVRDSCVR